MGHTIMAVWLVPTRCGGLDSRALTLKFQTGTFMTRRRIALTLAAIPLVAVGSAANAQDNYPPSPSPSPSSTSTVLGGVETRTPSPIAEVPDTNVGGNNTPDAAPDSGNGLAATGADVALLGLAGLGAVAAGGGAVYATRRRRHG